MPKPADLARVQRSAANHLQLLAATAEQQADLVDLVEESIAWATGDQDRDDTAAGTTVGRAQLGLADNLASLREAVPDAWDELLSEMRVGLPELWQAAHEGRPDLRDLP